MSQAKHMMDRNRELREIATARLLQNGALKQCEKHEDILSDVMDPGAVEETEGEYAELVAAGEIDCELHEWETAIGRVTNLAPDGCPMCQNDAMRDD